MINDLLAEAGETIRQYHLEAPHMEGVYEGPIRGELESLCELMRELRLELVAPGGPAHLTLSEWGRETIAE